MDNRDKTLIIVAIVICVIICCVEPPFPDYTFEPLESLGEVGVLILGVLLTLICGWGVAEIVKRRS